MTDEPTIYEMIENFEGEVEQAVFFEDEAWMRDLFDGSDRLYELLDAELPGEGDSLRNTIADCLWKLEDALGA